MRLTGVVPILCTPYDSDGNPAPAEVAAEVAWAAARGADAVGVAIVSEVFFLTEQEWETVVAAAVSAGVAAGIPVVVSVGRDDAEATRTRARRAADLGASVLMAYPPPDGSRDTADLVAFYEAVASAGVPVFVQDAPGLAGAEIPLEAYPAVAAVDGVAGFKIEVVPTPVKVAAARRLLPPETVILGGAGGFAFADELDAGAEGTMPGVTACAPLVEVWRAHLGGDPGAARAAFDRHAGLWAFGLDHLDCFTHLEKTALVSAGVFTSDHTRLGERAPAEAVAAKLALAAGPGQAS